MSWKGLANDEDPRLRDQFGQLAGAHKDINGNQVGQSYVTGDASMPAKPGWQPNGGGQAQDAQGNLIGGTSAWDQDVNRYRSEGEAAQGRTGVTLDQTQADQARGLQMGGLGLMGQAARGQAPSQAAILGASATDTTTRGALSGMAGARGPGAAVSTSGAAGGAAADQMARQNASVTNLRAQEMARNQQEYAAGAGALRSQDNQAAITNARWEAQQRALNEAKQQGKEGLAYGTRETQANSAAAYNDMMRGYGESEANRAKSRNEHEKNRTYKTITNTLENAMPSDEETKTHVRHVTLGSLTGLSRFIHGR